MPKIVRAEEKAWAKMAWELIYKWRAALNRNYPLKPGPGPLALLCLLTPSLNPPCYIAMLDNQSKLSTPTNLLLVSMPPAPPVPTFQLSLQKCIQEMEKELSALRS